MNDTQNNPINPAIPHIQVPKKPVPTVSGMTMAVGRGEGTVALPVRPLPASAPSPTAAEGAELSFLDEFAEHEVNKETGPGSKLSDVTPPTPPTPMDEKTTQISGQSVVVLDPDNILSEKPAEKRIETISQVPERTVTPTPSVVPPVIHEPSREEQVAALQKDMERTQEKRKLLQEITKTLTQKRQRIENRLLPFKQKEAQLQSILLAAEDKEEHAIGNEDKRKSELARWSHVEEEYALRKEMLSVKEEIEAVMNEIDSNRQAYEQLEKEELLLQKRIETLEIDSQRTYLKQELAGAMRERGGLEGQYHQLETELEKSKTILTEITNKEKNIEQESRTILSESEQVQRVEELKQRIEQRYKLEKERHEIEIARWKTEDELATLEQRLHSVKVILDRSRRSQLEIEDKLQALDTLQK